MKFVDNNDVFEITKFISFFINKNYHFRIIFDSNLNNYEIIKKRLLIKQSEFIVEKMNRIIEYVKINVVDTKQKMTIRINKIRLSINFKIENYVWLNRRHIKTIRLFDKLNDKKLNSFKVVKKRNIVYELKLFDDMHIHFVFHSWLLRKNFRNSLKKQQNDSSKFVIANEMFEWKLNVKNNILKDVRSLIINSTKKFQHIYCNAMMTNDLSFDDKHVFFSDFVIDNRQTDFRLAVDKLIDKFLTICLNQNRRHRFDVMLSSHVKQYSCWYF